MNKKGKILFCALLTICFFTSYSQVRKNKNLKHYICYECNNDDVEIDAFIVSNEYLQCKKSNQYRFYDISISENKIVITEYNKAEQVQNKMEYENLIVEHRRDFDVYTEDDGNNDGNQGFKQIFVSKDRKKIISYYITYSYLKIQAVYVLK